MRKNMNIAFYTRVGNRSQLKNPNVNTVLERKVNSSKVVVEGDFQYLEMISNGLYKIGDIINGSNSRK